MKKGKKSRLDEMQEQKMLQIEHNGCWLAFFGLFAVILVQLVYYGMEEAERFAGEWIVFMCMALYLVAACIKNGIWDRRLRPSFQTNLYASAAGGLVGGFVRFLAAYRQCGDFWAALRIGVIIFFCVLVVCTAVMSLGAFLYRKRVERLDAEAEMEAGDAQGEETGGHGK